MSAATKKQVSLIAILLAGITFIVFLPALSSDFLNFDDPVYVTENIHVQHGLTWENLQWAFSTRHAEFWHPLTWLSHMLDWQIYRDNPHGHHFTNVLLHSGSSVLLLFFLWQMTGKIWKSAIVAALFAWHPLHIESVAWIAERKDVLSTFFGFATLLAYVRYVRQPGTRLYVVSLTLFCLSLMAKSMLVTLPFVLCLLDLWPLQRFSLLQPRTSNVRLSKLLLEKLPFFLVAFAFCVITYLAQKSGGSLASTESLPMGARIANAFVSYIRYPAKMFYPINLAVSYPHPLHWPLVISSAAAAFLLGFSAFAIFLIRSRPHVAVGWFWYLGVLFPVIGLIQVGSHAMADRYSYVSLIGLFITITWEADLFFSKLKLPSQGRACLTVAALLACVCITSFQLQFWKNNQTLFERALKVTKKNFSAHFGLGNHFVERGRVDEGLVHLKEASHLAPDVAEIYGKIALAEVRNGDYESAVENYQKALQLKPLLAEALNNLAWLKATAADSSIRDGEEAIKLAQLACELTSYKKPVMIGTLAAAYAEAGRFSEAIETAKRAENLAFSLGQKQLAETNHKLIELYQTGKPFRDLPSSN